MSVTLHVCTTCRAGEAVREGIVPWRSRPGIFGRQPPARIPPLVQPRDAAPETFK